MGSIPLIHSFSDLRNFCTLALFFVLLSLTCVSLVGRSSRGHCRVTLLGLSLLVVPFLPASNLFLRVGFVVAERILYIPRYTIVGKFGGDVNLAGLANHQNIAKFKFEDVICAIMHKSPNSPIPKYIPFAKFNAH